MQEELACPGVGRNVQRQCTDKLCSLLFLICNCLFIALLIVSLSQGNINKIVKGTDYNGNVCGSGYPDGLTINESEWQSRTLLWFPFSYDTQAKEFRITSALQYGICVQECNPANNLQTTYGGSANETAQTFAVYLQSSETFHRCVPNFNTYECPSGNCTGNEKSNDRVANELGFGGFFFGLVEQVYSSIWITLLFLIIAVIICFLWIIVLRRAVKPVVIIVLTAILVVGGFIVLALFLHYRDLQNDASTKGTDSSKIALAAGIISAVLLFLYVCVIAYLRKSIMLSCDIIEEGSKIIVDIPQIMLVPIWTSVIIFLNLVTFASIAALLYTVGTNKMVDTQVSNLLGQMVTVKTHEYVRPTWVSYGQVFNLFMMLWILAFQNGVAYMTISLTGVIWFFSVPGNQKVTKSPVCESYCIVQKFHGGTVAFGTLLFTIVAIARFLLNAFEKHMQKTLKNNTACCLLLCCANCCLSCLDRIIRFLTEHGFVMTAMTGAPLISAARESVSLLTSTPAVLSINLISDVVIGISRILITLFVTATGAAALSHYSNDSNVTVVACVVVLALGTWFIAGTFTRVLTVCIDTTLLCFSYDVKHNNGMDRPYYSPDDLKEHISRANAHHQSKHMDKEALLNQH